MKSLLIKFKNLLGSGPHLLLLGSILEGLTLYIRPWISFPFSIGSEIQIILILLCAILFLSGMAWFNHSVNLIKVHLKEETYELITQGPFNYVRHPLYTTLLFTIPPILIIVFSDLIFIIPWIIILILSHYIVLIEERDLLRIFGDRYKNYQRYVPALLPFKGNGGNRYRKVHGEC